MPKLTKFQTNFIGGIISPPMWGRIDLGKKYGSSLKECTNFLPRPQGGLMSRTGSTFLNDTELDGGTFELIEFQPNAAEAYVIEITDQYARAFPSDFVENPNLNAITDIGAAPWLGSELKDLRWDYKSDSIIITHPNHEPREIRFLGKGASPDFEITTLDWTSHAFQRPDKSNTVIRYVDDTNYLKIISSNATEFDVIPGKEYIEFKFDGEWQLAKLASVGGTDTFKDGSNVPAPAGNVAYVIPVSKMVQDFSKATKSYVCQKEYLQDTYPDNTLTEDQVVGILYPDLTPATVDYWWLRADTQVFTDDMVGAWVRFRSDYNKCYSSDDYADNQIRWGKIYRRVGQEAQTTGFMVGPSHKELIEGHTYRAMRAGSGYLLHTNCPIQAGDKLAWDLSFRYNAEGESFQPAAVWWWDTTLKGYAAKTNPTPATADFFSSDTILEDMDTRVSFDVAILTDLIGPPVGSDSHSDNLLTLTGEMTIDEESDDQLGHLGHIVCGLDFFYNASTNPTGIRAGQYIMAKHDTGYITYRVETITSLTRAEVKVMDGVLPIDIETDELYDNGRTSDYRISAWWSGNWPYTVAFHESRLAFGGSPEFPNHIWVSKLEDDLDFRTIENDGRQLDTSGITYPLPGKSFDRVVWMSSGSVLSIGVLNSEWQMRPNQFGAPLTPLNIRITKQTENGSTLQPLSVNGILIFPDATDKKVVEYFFDFQQDKHISRDITIFANELFYKDPIIDYCYQSDPFGVIWCVTESGRMVSLTYDRNQEVYAWAEHYTEGRWVGVATFRATQDTAGEDRVLAYVERDLPAGTKTYAERLDPLIVQYKNPLTKFGLRTLDCVARVDTGGGAAENPDDPPVDGNIIFEYEPAWVDPWQFVYPEYSLTNPVDSLPISHFTARLHWDNNIPGTGMTEDNYTDEDYKDDWVAANPSVQNYSGPPWAVIPGGTNPNEWATSFGAITWEATAGDFICADLLNDHIINAIGFSFGWAHTVCPIHTMRIWVAQSSQRADGALFDESTITWTLAETIDLSAETNKRQELALSTPVTARYVKIEVANGWIDKGDPSNYNISINRIDWDLSVSTANYTEDLSLTRKAGFHSLYRNFGDKNWYVVALNAGKVKGLDTLLDGSYGTSGWTSTGAYTDIEDPNPITIELRATDTPVRLCRLYWLGLILSGKGLPSHIKVWYKTPDDTDWVYYRHFRMPSGEDIAYSGSNQHDGLAISHKLYGAAENQAPAYALQFPQKWYTAFKFEIGMTNGYSGIGSENVSLGDIWYYDRWDRATGEPTSIPTFTPDTIIPMGHKWDLTEHPSGYMSWNSLSSTGPDNLDGEGLLFYQESRAYVYSDLKKAISGKNVRVSFDVDRHDGSYFQLTLAGLANYKGGGSVCGDMTNMVGGLSTDGTARGMFKVETTGSKSFDLAMDDLLTGDPYTAVSPFIIYWGDYQTIQISNFKVEYI
jgi:hypothetical protein